MTLQLDTTGYVQCPAPDQKPNESTGCWFWSDLSPFMQGYIEALFADDATQDAIMDEHGRVRHGFSDLAQETLKRIVADCESAAKSFGKGATSADGRRFYHLRQSGVNDLWPPQTLQLCDDGKVRFA